MMPQVIFHVWIALTQIVKEQELLANIATINQEYQLLSL